MNKKFLKLLKDIKYPKKQEGWDVKGILYKKTNKSYKFDLSPIQKFADTKSQGKVGSFTTKAEKMVFSFKDKWIILDIEELHSYIKENKIKELLLENLLKDLNWNMVIAK